MICLDNITDVEVLNRIQQAFDRKGIWIKIPEIGTELALLHGEVRNGKFHDHCLNQSVLLKVKPHEGFLADKVDVYADPHGEEFLATVEIKESAWISRGYYARLTSVNK